MRVPHEGIDAPESGQHCKMADSTEWPCGADATKYAGKLAGGHMVECVVIGLDKYRRLLGTCSLLDAEGKPERPTLNERMVVVCRRHQFRRGLEQ
jgi:endonuclease YncB( thermonuclease family)